MVLYEPEIQMGAFIHYPKTGKDRGESAVIYSKTPFSIATINRFQNAIDTVVECIYFLASMQFCAGNCARESSSERD
jgi:hypothetical protein